MTSSLNSHTNLPAVSVLVIATRSYIDYANALIKSVSEKILPSSEIEVILFCDDPSLVAEVTRSSMTLKIVKIPALGWPDATLLRYQIFQEHWSQISGQLVMYLDADTLVMTEVTHELLDSESWANGVALVRHPGYFNRNIFFRLLIKTRIGPWESRRGSTAFVPLKHRHNYVCGGVWMGTNEKIKEMCEQLSHNVNQDKDRGLIAIHHDESHLNSWPQKNSVTLLTPRWAFARHYRNLKNLAPLIEVVHKPDTWNKETGL